MIPFRQVSAAVRPNTPHTSGVGEALQAAGQGLQNFGQSAMRVSQTLKQQDIAQQSYDVSRVVEEVRAANDKMYQEAMANGNYKAAEEVTAALPEALLGGLPSDLLPEVRRDAELRIRHDSNQRMLQRTGQIRASRLQDSIVDHEQTINADVSANLSPEAIAEKKLLPTAALLEAAATPTGKAAVYQSLERGMNNAVQAQVARSTMAMHSADGDPARSAQVVDNALLDMENSIDALTAMNGKDGYDGALNNQLEYLKRNYVAMSKQKEVALQTAQLRHITDTTTGFAQTFTSLGNGVMLPDNPMYMSVLGVVGNAKLTPEQGAAELIRVGRLPADAKTQGDLASKIVSLREKFKSPEGKRALTAIMHEQARPQMMAQMEAFAAGRISEEDYVNKSALVVEGLADNFGAPIKHEDAVAVVLHKGFDALGGSMEGRMRQMQLTRKYPELSSRWVRANGMQSKESLAVLASSQGSGVPLTVMREPSLTDIGEASSSLKNNSSSIPGYVEWVDRYRQLGFTDQEAQNAVGALVAARIPNLMEMEKDKRDAAVKKEFDSLHNAKRNYTNVAFSGSSLQINVLGGFGHKDFVRTSKDVLYTPDAGNDWTAQAKRKLAGSYFDQAYELANPMALVQGIVQSQREFGMSFYKQAVTADGSRLGSIPHSYGQTAAINAAFAVPNTAALNTLMLGIQDVDKEDLRRWALGHDGDKAEARYKAYEKILGWTESGTGSETDKDYPVKCMLAGMRLSTTKTDGGVLSNLQFERRGSSLYIMKRGVSGTNDTVTAPLENSVTKTPIIISGDYATAMEDAVVTTRAGVSVNSSLIRSVGQTTPMALAVSAQDWSTARDNVASYITKTRNTMKDYLRMEAEMAKAATLPPVPEEESGVFFAPRPMSLRYTPNAKAEASAAAAHVKNRQAAVLPAMKDRANTMRQLLAQVPIIGGKYRPEAARFGETESGRKMWEDVLTLAREMEAGYGVAPGEILGTGK